VSEAPILDLPYGDSTYRRRIELRPEPGAMWAEMEDYPHHFTVRIEHRAGVVVAIEATGIRHPWDACPVGAAGVRALVGVTLKDAMEGATWAADRTAQCVHVVDLAVLAVRHALDEERTSYEARVAPSARRLREATLDRNGNRVLAWSLDGGRVIGPDRFVGLALGRRPFFDWIRGNLDGQEQEAATVLRRACSIAIGRGMDLDAFAYAADAHPADNSCYVYSTGVAVTAHRMVGSTRATEAGQTERAGPA
jgi:Protein of unknown function (DUF2889)